MRLVAIQQRLFVINFPPAVTLETSLVPAAQKAHKYILSENRMVPVHHDPGVFGKNGHTGRAVRSGMLVFVFQPLLGIF